MSSHDTATGAQVLALKQIGIKNAEIIEQTQVSGRRIRNYIKGAKDRGWNSDLKGPILDICRLRAWKWTCKEGNTREARRDPFLS